MYEIPEWYTINPNPTHYIDLNAKDEWQKEVYQYAAEVMAKKNLKSVIDVGCGSAYKLIKYLSAYDTIGVETEPCYSFLRKTYPDRKWLLSGEPESSFVQHTIQADFIVCSDVIEHIVDPTNLIDYIKTLQGKFILFSTPDRQVLREQSGERCWTGPPRNPAHVREWTFLEFHAFLNFHFQVVEALHCKNQKECMMFLCKPLK